MSEIIAEYGSNAALLLKVHPAIIVTTPELVSEYVQSVIGLQIPEGLIPGSSIVDTTPDNMSKSYDIFTHIEDCVLIIGTIDENYYFSNGDHVDSAGMTFTLINTKHNKVATGFMVDDCYHVYGKNRILQLKTIIDKAVEVLKSKDPVLNFSYVSPKFSGRVTENSPFIVNITHSISGHLSRYFDEIKTLVFRFSDNFKFKSELTKVAISYYEGFTLKFAYLDFSDSDNPQFIDFESEAACDAFLMDTFKLPYRLINWRSQP